MKVSYLPQFLLKNITRVYKLNYTFINYLKSNFSEYFIKTEKIESQYGRLYSQLFTWRQKGDYDDLFDFDKNKVLPYFEPVNEFILLIEDMITK